MAQYEFGAGVLFGRSISAGNYPTPAQFGTLQEVSIDISFTTKALYGTYQFPAAIGRGTGKITGKAKFASFDAQTFNDLFFGLTNPAAGIQRTVSNEAQTVGAGSANQITVTNNATFTQDLGVVISATGVRQTRVANSPANGSYTCNESSGVYVFNNSSNNVAMLVSYSYKDAGNGKTISITNQLLGASPQFLAVLSQKFTTAGTSKEMTLQLNACVSSKLTMMTKLEDFVIPEFDFEAFADASNTIGGFYMEN